ncbi:MAG: BatD family protein [Alphaproteobacteria bacterium]
MVKISITHLLLACFALFLVTQSVAAQSFTASTDQTQIVIGQSVTLQLSLKDVAPSDYLDYSAVEKDFTIHGQNQSTRTETVNGSLSSSIDWYLALLPKAQGEFTIPAFTVKTDAGSLSTQPIKITVSKQKMASNGEPFKERAIKVETAVNNLTPYQNEPIVFTARLIATKTVTDVSLAPFKIEGTIIEPYEKPTVKEEAINGKRTAIVEAKYLITPLVSGKLRIPSFTYKGQIESQRHKGRKNPFGNLGIFGAFEVYEPFIIGGNPITLDVKAPAIQMDPWLPLQSFEISDELDVEDNTEVGQPITRKITLTGVGASGSSLPNLEGYISAGKAFKVYADKPEFGQDIDNDDQTLKGWRQENYTLIPVKAGEVTFPEIKVPWWNVKARKVEYATIPEKSVTVVQGDVIPPKPIERAPLFEDDVVIVENETRPAALGGNAHSSDHSTLYLVITALGGVICVLMVMNIYLLSRLSGTKNSSKTSDSKPRVKNKVRMSALSKISSVQELRDFVQNYAQIHLGMQKGASLRSIANSITQDVPFFKTLEDALYQGGDHDIEELKVQAKEALNIIATNQPSKKEEDTLSPLNPS